MHMFQELLNTSWIYCVGVPYQELVHAGLLSNLVIIVVFL